jgi:capsular exopolysaccharide synthesis family protein
MDRIQRALDKAKQKQKQTGSENELEQTTSTVVLDALVKSKPKVSSTDNIENIAYSNTRVVETSYEELEKNRVIAGMYSNPNSTVFRMLRTQVLKKMRENHFQTLAVSSPTAGEGKSLIASNLAVAIAMELNQTVLLIDMDLRNPSISKYFSLSSELGLKDYLETDLALEDVLVNPGIKRLVILPGRDRAEDSAELLSSPKMASLVKDVKSKYNSRIIIFDVPPILQTDDVLLSSDYFDSTLLVLEDGKNKEVEITKALQLLEGHHLLGTVLNKSEKPPKHQNY